MNKRLSFTFVIITLTVDAMGIGLIIPVMPDLLQEIEDEIWVTPPFGAGF